MTEEQKSLIAKAVATVLSQASPSDIHDFLRDSYMEFRQERSLQLVAA